MHCVGSKVFMSFCLAKVTQKVPQVFTQQTSGEVAAALGVPAPGAPGQSQLPVSNPSLLKYVEANIIAPEWGTKQRQKQNGWKTLNWKEKKIKQKVTEIWNVMDSYSTHTGMEWNFCLWLENRGRDCSKRRPWGNSCVCLLENCTNKLEKGLWEKRGIENCLLSLPTPKQQQFMKPQVDELKEREDLLQGDEPATSHCRRGTTASFPNTTAFVRESSRNEPVPLPDVRKDLL